MRFTLLSDASRWTLSVPTFYVMPRALGEFVLLSVKWIFSDENLETQPTCIDSFNEATDPFTLLFFDFLLDCPSASTCRNRHLPPFVHPDSDL